MTNKRVSIVIVLAGLMTAAAFSAKIKSDYDKSIDFSSYRTYAWGKNTQPTRVAAGLFISAAINTALESRGLQQANIDEADIVVAYAAAGDQMMSFGVVDPSYAAIGGQPLPGSTVWTTGTNSPTGGSFVRKGSLVIDIYDRRQQKLIWTAVATDTIQDKPDKAINQINNMVAEMFSRYPVKSAKMS